MKKTVKTVNINALPITAREKEILKKIYAKRNGTWFKLSYETYYENTPEKKNGVSAAWKGHTVSKTTVTSARKGIDYNNVKEVKEKRAREGYTPSQEASNKHYIDKTLLKSNDKNEFFIALFPNKGKPSCTYKLDGKPISKEKLIELGVMQPSFWKSKNGKKPPMYTLGLDKIIDIY